MHPDSMENMKKMLNFVLTPEFIGEHCLIVDYGGRRVDAHHETYYSLVKEFKNTEYRSLDIAPGDGVDVVLTDPYHSPFPDNSVDVVISGQMLEHCEFFWLTILDIARIVRPGGYVLLIAPSTGSVHRHPVDCWRFYPDAYPALAKWAKLTFVDGWMVLASSWGDQVGILRKPSQELLELRMSFEHFCAMFGVKAEVNGITGYLNSSGDFFPTDLLTRQFNGLHYFPLTDVKNVVQNG